jgi:predicted AAA+ superfamily ATPase
MEIPRALEQIILGRLTDYSRIIVIYGPRQSGKTTLVRTILAGLDSKWLYLNGDTREDREALTDPTGRGLETLIGGYAGIFVDEAQRFPEIGLTLKRLHDQFAGLKLLVTGSSSLEIGDRIREPLTGRTWTYTLFPIAALELSSRLTPLELDRRLEELLVVGAYPALFSIPNRQDQIAHIREVADAYLYKDILELSGIRNARKLRDLLRLLAFQVGNEVSFAEIGSRCSLSADSVISYIDLLEKSFVLFRLGAWNRNLRKEVSKKCKVYFLDNGVRNALIDDFKALAYRNDVGALWENFLVAERRKRNAYSGAYGGSYFWRLQTGAELDYLEDQDGRLSAYEFKWRKSAASVPASFAQAYPDHGFSLVNRDTWQSFVGVGVKAKASEGEHPTH